MTFLELLKQRIVLFDGGMGSMLFQAGLGGGDCPETWNLSHPDVVSGIHRAYYEAGSDVVTTNSFGGSSLKLASYGLEKEAKQINIAAANLARKVCPKDRFVAGSVGPTGQFLQPLGTLDEDTLYNSFKEQVMALAEGGVDVICVETMMDLTEASLAVRATRENTDLPVIATMTFNATPRGFFTMMGIDPRTAAQTLTAEGAAVVGANCGNGPHEMIDLVPAFRQAVDTPLLFQSNAGLPKLVEGRTIYDLGPAEYAEYVPRFLQAGARLIGGCCGTTPDHIRTIKDLLDHSLSTL